MRPLLHHLPADYIHEEVYTGVGGGTPRVYPPWTPLTSRPFPGYVCPVEILYLSCIDVKSSSSRSYNHRRNHYEIQDSRKAQKNKRQDIKQDQKKITGGNETANDISKEVEIFPANTTCTIPPFPDPGKLSSCY